KFNETTNFICGNYALRLDDAQQRTERAEQPEGDSSIVQPHQPEADGQRGVRERLHDPALDRRNQLRVCGFCRIERNELRKYRVATEENLLVQGSGVQEQR